MTPDETVAYSDTELDLDLRWWDAANYLTVGQSYLGDNALLREPQAAAHIKPRPLGHWGSTPAPSAIYVPLIRQFRQFSTPRGIPSHASVQTPDSIHEGGELGHSLLPAAGPGFDHPAHLAMLEVRRLQHQRPPRGPLSPRRCRSHRQFHQAR